ncbi:hypothetical protein O181_079463 [Austropuccinia psidii MF-1]|uniref:Integrase catalytic domain-containing protein n=1 Tax=Austropuccinia psidii MF-1 TaxID=1389203 RepID=A0A9Q3FGR0_9BASI|nr:hypothetical protein [Austropuccinia psidii MF-1]
MPLECVHMDLCGPVSPLSRGKNRYILQIADGYLCYRLSYMLSQKSLAFEAFKAFKAYAEPQTNFRVRQVVTENGREFIGNNFKTLFANEGIECLLTAPHTPQQNPFAERANRTLLERTMCLLLDSKSDHSWWGEALSTETYLLNRTPIGSIGFKIPFSLFFGKTPKTDNLHPFGCLGHKNYKVFNMVTGKLQITHYCIFHDTSVGLENPSENPAVVFTIPSVEAYTSVPVLTAAEVEDSGDLSSCGSSPSPSCAQSGHTDSKSAADAAESRSLEPTRSLPKGWVMENVPVVAPNNISCSIDMSNILNLKRNRVDLKKAIANKISSIEENDVWVPVKTPSNANILGSTWVFREKEDQDGSIVKYKACLCMQGFSQKEGVDFNEAYAPTGRMTSLCFLLSHYASSDLKIHQMDVKTAFLNGKQSTVALSTTEAELGSLVELTQDTLWFKKLLDDLKLYPIIKLSCDNQGAIALCNNPLYHHRTRHFNIFLNWLRDLVLSKFVSLNYVSTSNMWADILTKGLGRIKHQEFNQVFKSIAVFSKRACED